MKSVARKLVIVIPDAVTDSWPQIPGTAQFDLLDRIGFTILNRSRIETWWEA